MLGSRPQTCYPVSRLPACCEPSPAIDIRLAVVVTAFIAFILLTVSSSLMYYLENMHEPSKDFKSIPMSAWWGVAALTTTGYGDIVPKTAAGQVLGGIVAFVGVAVFALPAGILGSGFTEVLYQERKAAEARASAILPPGAIHDACYVAPLHAPSVEMHAAIATGAVCTSHLALQSSAGLGGRPACCGGHGRSFPMERKQH